MSSPRKGQWRGALIFSLICVWINGWVNNREAGDLRRRRIHYDVILIINQPPRLIVVYKTTPVCDIILFMEGHVMDYMRKWQQSQLKLHVFPRGEDLPLLSSSNNYYVFNKLCLFQVYVCQGTWLLLLHVMVYRLLGTRTSTNQCWIIASHTWIMNQRTKRNHALKEVMYEMSVIWFHCRCTQHQGPRLLT